MKKTLLLCAALAMASLSFAAVAAPAPTGEPPGIYAASIDASSPLAMLDAKTSAPVAVPGQAAQPASPAKASPFAPVASGGTLPPGCPQWGVPGCTKGGSSRL